MKITNTNTNNKPMKKPQKFDAQFFVDTAEYNYNLGYLKAIEEVEKIINNNLNIKINVFNYFSNISNEINKLKEDLKK